MESELPLNWRVAKDSDGKEYYFNELTGETSWSVPQDSKPKAAPAAAEPTPVHPSISADADEFAPAEAPPVVQPPMFGNPGKRTGGAGSSGLSATLGTGVLPRVQIIIFCSVVVLFQSIMVMPAAPAVAADQGAVAGRMLQDVNASSPPPPPPASPPSVTAEPVVSDAPTSCAIGAVGDGAAESYGISVGVISIVASAAFLAVAKYRPHVFSNWVMPKLKAELSISHLYAIFMAAWWIPAAAILTFGAPFTGTSNAYFATWAATVTSVLLLSKSFARVQVAMKSMSEIRGDVNVKSLAGLALASAIVLLAAIEWVGYTGEATFALLASMISCVLASLLYYLVDRKKASRPVKKALGALLLIMWTICVAVLTFDGPFLGARAHAHAHAHGRTRAQSRRPTPMRARLSRIHRQRSHALLPPSCSRRRGRHGQRLLRHVVRLLLLRLLCVPGVLRRPVAARCRHQLVLLFAI